MLSIFSFKRYVTFFWYIQPHHTFLAEQYRRDGDPIAVHSLLNLSSIQPWNLDGLWTSATHEGALALDSYRVRMISTKLAGVRALSISCISGGSTNKCSPEPQLEQNWYNGSGTLNLTAIRTNGERNGTILGYQLKIYFSGFSDGTRWISKAAVIGTVNANFTQILWYDHSVWARVAPDQYDICCARCTQTPACNAWTINPLRQTCALVSTATTAYPSAFTVSGYPLRSDPAAFCKAKILGNRYAMQDATMAKNIECGSVAPGSTNAKFPKPWRDTNRKHRGTAWLFFPSRAAGPKFRLDGLWVVKNGPGYGETYILESSTDGSHFTATCAIGDGDCACYTPPALDRRKYCLTLCTCCRRSDQPGPQWFCLAQWERNPRCKDRPRHISPRQS
eukprot:SAG31_NODE_257_length_18942_cov_6.099135_10_plen_392_part_00